MEWLTEAGSAAMATLLSIEVLFLLTKLMGSKQVSQMTMSDYMVGITIGSIAAVLEHDGVVSFLPKEAARYAAPADLDLPLKKSLIYTPFIMDSMLLTLWDGVEI